MKINEKFLKDKRLSLFFFKVLKFIFIISFLYKYKKVNKLSVYEIFTHLPQSYPIKNRINTGDKMIQKRLDIFFSLFIKELFILFFLKCEYFNKMNKGKKPIIIIQIYLRMFSME